MRRSAIVFFLAMVLVLMVGAAALATPLTISEPGSFFIFGEYAPANLGEFDDLNVFYAGVGYVVSDNFALGVLGEFDPWYNSYGGFVMLALDPFLFKGEFVYSGSDWDTKLTALYVFQTGKLNVGIGGGVRFCDDFDDVGYFIEAAASYEIAKNLNIYGTVDYYPADGNFTYSVGASLAF